MFLCANRLIITFLVSCISSTFTYNLYDVIYPSAQRGLDSSDEEAESEDVSAIMGFSTFGGEALFLIIPALTKL